MTTTIAFHGHKIRTQTQRRYVVVAARPEPVTVERYGVYDGVQQTRTETYPAFAHIDNRTDNYATALVKANRARNRYASGTYVAIFDTTTNEEVREMTVIDQHEIEVPEAAYALTGQTVVSAGIDDQGWLAIRLDNGKTVTISAEHGYSLVTDIGWTA